jgi:hypothetical protein
VAWEVLSVEEKVISLAAELVVARESSLVEEWVIWLVQGSGVVWEFLSA